MSFSRSARSHRRLMAPRRLRSMCASSAGIGGVDTDIERRQPFGNHPLQIRFGETGQGGEVAVQERQPVVVVLEIQALPHALEEAGR